LGNVKPLDAITHCTYYTRAHADVQTKTDTWWRSVNTHTNLSTPYAWPWSQLTVHYVLTTTFKQVTLQVGKLLTGFECSTSDSLCYNFFFTNNLIQMHIQ